MASFRKQGVPRMDAKTPRTLGRTTLACNSRQKDLIRFESVANPVLRGICYVACDGHACSILLSGRYEMSSGHVHSYGDLDNSKVDMSDYNNASSGPVRIPRTLKRRRHWSMSGPYGYEPQVTGHGNVTGTRVGGIVNSWTYEVEEHQKSRDLSLLQEGIRTRAKGRPSEKGMVQCGGRSLSRDLQVHVNVAKNELAAYYGKASMDSQDVAATYVISGILKQQTRHDEDMDVDVEEQETIDSDGYDDDETEPITECGFTVVGEGDLELCDHTAKLRYSQIDAMHIYSLSPSPILDGGFLCVPTKKLRQIDLEKGEELAKIVGTVLSKDIQQVRSSKGLQTTKKAPSPPVAGPSKLKASGSLTEATSKPPNKKVQPAKSGTLDWSKAKPKVVKEERKETKVEAKPKQPLKPPTATKADEKIVKKEETETLIKKAQPKRGTKRKSASALISDSEDNSSSSHSKPPPPKESEIKVKKGVVVSEDEEDDDDKPRIATRKPSRKVYRAARQVDSDAERDLRAMMEVDDDQVTHASRDVQAVKKEEEEEEEPSKQCDDDVDMADETVPAPKRKRKEKKVIPVGRNGLKKKRVVKSRESIDAKDYMVTEDYSSYESVDEEEEPPAAAKSKSKMSKVNKVERGQ
ncbi:DNA polymerase subunit Cdc27-domain-containing protein [Armillaria novae-zelandiae]|uniref:DNA polymerase delta subunit 3 n=1 Tax=Armillaria novae-zelandiae TaxID=153914 RepID=A0AA39PRW5_9AGAR|nr:DNA polymerase subunit Cdc27-domain-containing protein [Armillaria novae-zelandiae]